MEILNSITFNTAKNRTTKFAQLIFITIKIVKNLLYRWTNITPLYITTLLYFEIILTLWAACSSHLENFKIAKLQNSKVYWSFMFYHCYFSHIRVGYDELLLCSFYHLRSTYIMVCLLYACKTSFLLRYKSFMEV